MPPRSVIVVVVFFWLASSGWLFQREIWPRLVPGEPPRFALAHDDDKTQPRVPVRWTAFHETKTRQGHLTYKIQTFVTHRDHNREDVFDLVAQLKPANDPDLKQHFLEVFHLGSFETTYRVGRDGRMLGLKTDVEFRHGLIDRFGDQKGEFEGEVDDGLCRLVWRKQNKQERSEGKIDVEVSHTGAVLLPLHPLERIPGLRPGKRWGLYLLDPLDQASTPTAPPRLAWVNAEVREEFEDIIWERETLRCRVIDFKGDNGSIKGTIHVDAESGQDEVRQMMLILGDDTWRIIRGDAARKDAEETGP